MCRLSDGEKRGTARWYERTQSATQRQTAGMQQHIAAFMFKEAAAEWAIHKVRLLN